MRAFNPVLLLLVFSLCMACDKKNKEAKTGNIEPEASYSGPRGAEESKCREACEKGPRLHFEAALAAELRLKPEEEHAKIKAGAEERWIAMKSKHEERVQGCVEQCKKMAKPGEVECLIAAKDMAETQSCIRKFQSRPKGALPPNASTSRSKGTPAPGTVKMPKMPKGPKVPGVHTPSVGNSELKGGEKVDAKVPEAKRVLNPAVKTPPKAAAPAAPAVKTPSAGPTAAKPAPVAVPDGKKTR